MPKNFVLHSEWPPAGDQPEAIEALTKGLLAGERFQTLMGVTGSGKTFTMANVIANVNRPALVLAHNKTLAAQLYSEFKLFFPENAVHYFVSYYDYYQPEAYIPASDTYIEKDASINDRIERLRLAATKALVERRDVLVVASVSCIYGLGKRENYEAAIFPFAEGSRWDHRAFMQHLMENYYERNDHVLETGKFRVRGDTIEIFPAYDENCIRVTFFDDEIERIDLIHPVTGKVVERLPEASIFPAQHYVTQTDAIERSKPLIEAEMERMAERFTNEGKFLEAQRIQMRTRYDLEMLSEVGYCSGIENYSIYLDGRRTGDPPGTLIDFFPEDFLMVVDESHITLPQVRGMFNGDRARKSVLVENGFRLPSCLDNRPLEWNEFEKKMGTAVFVSATPGDYETENSSRLVEQVIRPTGVVDPEVEVLPAKNQLDDLIERLRAVTAPGGADAHGKGGKSGRALVLTLTKKSSEDLAEYLRELQFKVKYIHSELNTFERAELVRDLRKGDIQILVGINLLREGMDLPEVSLVAILDADREGYLRSYRSLIQIMGRAARNVDSKVYLYADTETESIRKSVEETRRRRQKQLEFNERHGIVPRSVEKEVSSLLPPELLAAYSLEPGDSGVDGEGKAPVLSVKELERAMWEAVEKLDFERAAVLRDMIAGGGEDRKPATPAKPVKPGRPGKTRKTRRP
ncbi:MAG: excinuclease ABC subunit UvrB [Synergistaceae bacterium]|nr:excinuclease ABC subunit UvrB [Synergistaceae bacterium]